MTDTDQPKTGAALADELEKAVDRLAGISVPAMNGDNLAVTLCSFFCDGGDADDETGWSEAANEGYEQVRTAITAHFAPIIAALRAPAQVEGDLLNDLISAGKPVADAIQFFRRLDHPNAERWHSRMKRSYALLDKIAGALTRKGSA